MLTENDLRAALAEQDEVIAWLAEQNKKLTEENEQLCSMIPSTLPDLELSRDLFGAIVRF